jgi:hypothetical protein
VRIGLKGSFLFLIAAQAAHSLEEYFGALWEVLAPARAVSGVFSQDLPTGFAIANTLIVLLGILCYLGPIRRSWRGATAIAWFWVLLEFGNSVGHTVFAVTEGAYFPGLYTVPFLLAFSLLVAARLLKAKDGPDVI